MFLGCLDFFSKLLMDRVGFGVIVSGNFPEILGLTDYLYGMVVGVVGWSAFGGVFLGFVVE